MPPREQAPGTPICFKKKYQIGPSHLGKERAGHAAVEGPLVAVGHENPVTKQRLVSVALISLVLRIGGRRGRGNRAKGGETIRLAAPPTSHIRAPPLPFPPFTHNLATPSPHPLFSTSYLPKVLAGEEVGDVVKVPRDHHVPSSVGEAKGVAVALVAVGAKRHEANFVLQRSGQRTCARCIGSVELPLRTAADSIICPIGTRAITQGRNAQSRPTTPLAFYTQE